MSSQIPEVFIAKRYLATSRKAFSVSLLKWIGILGVALGVFSLIVVISIMKGFEHDFEKKILGFQAPVLLEVSAVETDQLPALEALKELSPAIIAAERRIEGELIIESSFGTSAGAQVRGVDRPLRNVQGLGRVQMAEPEELPLPGILLGTELAANLQVHPDFKDEVKLVFPFGDLSPTGEILPRVRRFRVVGLFDSGFYEYDSKFAIIPEASAARLFGEYGRASLGLYLKDASESDQLKTALIAAFPKRVWKVSTWRERNQRLFQALLLERWGMFVLLLTIVLIATFNIFALLSMIVLEKIKDMAVLRTVGLRIKQVMRIFLWQVAVIGLRGTVLGGVLGSLTCLYLHYFPYQLPPSYYIEFMPIAFDPFYIALIVVMAPLISVVAGLYPARQSCRPTIAEVLRYE